MDHIYFMLSKKARMKKNLKGKITDKKDKFPWARCWLPFRGKLTFLR